MVKAITIIPRSGPAGSSGAGPLNNTSYDGITINFSDSKTTDNFANAYTDGTIVDAQAPGYQTGNTYMIMNGTWPGDSGGSNIKTLSLKGTDLTTRYIPITFVPGDRAADYINMHWFGHGNNVGTLADNFEELKLVDVSIGYDNDFNEVNTYGANSSFDFLTGTTSWLFSPNISSHLNVDTTNTYIASDKSGSFNSGVSAVLWGKNYAIQIKPKAAAVGDSVKPIITSGTNGNNLVENSGAGQTVYTIEATDNVGVTSYAIGGTDASHLTVNSSTGVVTLNANPNYEVKSSYSFTVTATDAANNVSDPTTVTFSISNANDPTTGIPAITLAGTGSLAAPLVGDVLTATSGNIADPDGLGAFTYQWKRGVTNIGTAEAYTIVSGDVDSTITVSVSFTDGGGFASGLLTSDPTGQVTAPNNPATGVLTITGNAVDGQTLTANTSDIVDLDGVGAYTYQWKKNGTDISSATSSTYTIVTDDVGLQITVTVSFQDSAGNNESLISDPVTVAALDDKIYFWTEYNDASNNTAIYYGIYNTTKISGVILNYDLSLNTTSGQTTTVTDLSYIEQDQIDNETMISKKEWPIHVINTRTNASETEPDGVANQQIVFAGAMTQSINGMNMGVFAIVRGNITLTSIAAMVDNNSNFLTTDKYAIGQPANPPEITEPGGRPFGDINYDGSFNDLDIDIMSAYLLNNTDLSFNVYGGDTSTVLYTNKTAIEIIGTIDVDGKIVTQGLMTDYDILTYIDVNNNKIIDVGDLVRMLSKRANPAFSMTNGV